MTNEGFFLALDLAGKKCVVVGESPEADYRVQLLSEHGAAVVRIAARAFEDSDVVDAWLVVLGDRDAELCARLGRLCAASRTLFCAVDQPGQSSFHHVAVTRAGPVTLAVGTGGRAPALARRLREELERVLGASGLGHFAERVAELRDRTPSAERRERLARAVSGVRLSGELELPELDDD